MSAKNIRTRQKNKALEETGHRDGRDQSNDMVATATIFLGRNATDKEIER